MPKEVEMKKLKLSELVVESFKTSETRRFRGGEDTGTLLFICDTRGCPTNNCDTEVCNPGSVEQCDLDETDPLVCH